MAKKCDCHAVLEMLERDPRLRALPFAPRMLWFALVRAMQSLSVSVLQFGSHVPTPREIATMVGMSESELEANLEPLLVRGLLERDGHGALRSPLLVGMISRAEVNRANGLKGGAVRREQAAARRAQMNLPLTITGGLAAEAAGGKSEMEANGAGALSQAKLAADSSNSTKLKPAVEAEVFHRTGRAALEAAGFDPARSTVHYGIVRQWLADGASETLILGTIRAVLDKGARPKHLGYFTPAIQDAIAGGSVAGGNEPTARSMAWEYALEQWRVDGKQGAMPMPQDFAADGTRIAA